jgi:hypothetical protein
MALSILIRPCGPQLISSPHPFSLLPSLSLTSALSSPSSSPPPSSQVEHNLTCSPLNLLHYLLFWIPNYKRHLKRSHLTRSVSVSM